MTSSSELLLSMLLAQGASQQTPVFGTSVEVVRVDVAALRGGEPIGGLKAEDFEVRDNGVRQRVEAALEQEVALAATLVLDLSASVYGERLLGLREGAVAFIDGLTPKDRAALVCFSDQVSLRAEPTADFARVREVARTVEGSGTTALRDALFSALLLSSEGGHRTAVVVFSDGIDNMSWLSEDAVVETADRSDAVVYALVAPTPAGTVAANRNFLRRVVSTTGGQLWDTASGADLRATFHSALQHIRSRYLLSYVPTGVATAGWHKLEVKGRRKGAKVLARRGYFR